MSLELLSGVFIQALLSRISWAFLFIIRNLQAQYIGVYNKAFSVYQS